MKTVPIEPLKRLMLHALKRRDVSDEHARYLTDGLIESSLRGNDTHGVRLFPVYLAELDGGRCRSRPDFRWTGSGTAARLLDADHALGPVAGRVAVREVVRAARDHGVGAAAVRNSNYFGACAQYTLEMARQDMLGMSFTNSDALVAPVGGTKPFFGTNPMSFAARGEENEMFCVDMATSQVSFTTIKHHREHGIPLEPGWAVGPDGRDASCADAAEHVTALLPLGGHKGQCLAMVVEIFCCLLAGMPFDHQLSHFYDEPFDLPRKTSHFFLALDISAFQPLSSFRARLTELMGLVRTEGVEAGLRVMSPGDLETDVSEKRIKRGIPLAEVDLAQFRSVNEAAEPGAKVDL